MKALGAVGSASTTSVKSTLFLPGRRIVIFLPVALVVCTLLLAVGTGRPAAPFDLWAFLYLATLSIVFSRVTFELPRGRMNLTAISTQASGMLLPAQLAVVVGICSTVFRRRERSQSLPLTARIAGYTFWTTAGAAVHQVALIHSLPLWTADLLVVAVNSLTNWIVIGVFIGAMNGEPVLDVLRRNSSAAWFFAFAGFGAASILMVQLVRLGTPAGFLYASLVPVLAVALRSHVTLGAIQPTLRASVQQVTEQSRYVTELEAALHDLRNVLMTASVMASDTPSADLRPVLEEALQVSRRAFENGAGVPSAIAEVQLRELMARAILIARPVGESKKVRVVAELPTTPIPVIGDSIRLVEAITNLILNAIDVTPPGAEVRVACTVLKSGQRSVSVTDAGPGFLPGESLETTSFGSSAKGRGHGIGLRWTQSVALEHLGRLVLEASGSGGATVSLRLPPPREARRRLAALRRLASEEAGPAPN